MYPDIYYSPEWSSLYAEKESGKADAFLLEDQYGKIYYPFIRRGITQPVFLDVYEDIITPYGFSGPIILEAEDNEAKERLVLKFDKEFCDYCMDVNIVTEYVRFSPWLGNHKDFSSCYKVFPNRTTIGIDLNIRDIWTGEISSKRRNIIRHAQKLGVTVGFDDTGEMLDDFLKLYSLTIERNKIGDYYIFSKDFLKRHFTELKDHVFITYALLDGRCASVSFILQWGEYMHYHLSANDPDLFYSNANSLLLFETALYAQKHGFKYFMLGGGGASAELSNFKKSFTKQGIFDFYVGKRIRNKEVYSALVEAAPNANPNYFPEYRA